MKTSAQAVRLAAAFVLVVATTQVQSADLLQHGANTNGVNCLDVRSTDGSVLSFWCHGGSNQLFDMVSGRTIRLGTDRCLQYYDDSNFVNVTTCVAGRATQKWRARFDGSVVPVGYTKFGKCLTAAVSPNGVAALADCKAGATTQYFFSSALVPESGEVITGNGVCLDLSGTSALSFSCHGDSNQVWTSTFDDELRVSGTSCLEYDDVGLTTASVVTCSAASKQKWILDATSGKISPLGKPTRCLDVSKSPAFLAACASPLPKTQMFNTNALLAARTRNLKRTRIQAPSYFVGVNCLTVNRANKDVYVDRCTRTTDVWWEMAGDKTIKLAGQQCIDMSLTEPGRVLLYDCNGQSNQQWNLNAATGAVTNVYQPTKCLTFNTVNVTTFEQIVLRVETCNPAAPLPNQQFQPREFTEYNAPPRAEIQQAYCSQRAQHSGDLQFLRDTLFWSKTDVRALVPSVLTGREESNYYVSVVLESITVVISESANKLSEEDIVAKCSAVTNGAKALLDLAELMCRVRERQTELRPKVLDFLNINKPENKRLFATANYLLMANLQLQIAALPSDSVLLGLVAANIANAVNTELQTYTTPGNFAALSQYLSSSDMVWFAQAVQPLCTLKPSLALCAVSTLSNLIVSRKSLVDEIVKARAASLKTNELMSVDVLAKAEAFLQTVRNGFGNGGAVNYTTWLSITQLAIYGTNKASSTYNTTTLSFITSNDDIMVTMAVWPFFTDFELGTTQPWMPFFTALSDQFFKVRRLEIERLVYSSKAESLEAYFDGRTSDMAAVASQVLSRICMRFPTFKFCALIKFYALTNARSALYRRVKWLGSIANDEISGLVKGFNAAYVDGLALNDDLWTTTSVRLLFNSVELQVYPASTLLTTTTPPAFLMLYAVFTQYSNSLALLLPYFTFLSDQVAIAHFNALNKLVSNRDIAGMTVYIDPKSGATVSDLGVFGESVLPRLCNNPNNPEFAVCKLQDFYSGLLQVLAFEKSRSATTISLVEVAEVDVRKQLDVVDGEMKFADSITTIQDAANQIGQKVQEESDKIQALVIAESSAIRSEIGQSTQLLSTQMGALGRDIQADIVKSTEYLEKTIGAVADDIRQDIADNTQKLYSQLNAVQKGLQDSIESNTKKLATQIGNEAKITRDAISSATQQLTSTISKEAKATRDQITTSTERLYTKIGQEGQATRTAIEVSTNKLYNKIGEEGQLTRTAIDISTRKLTNVINTSTAKLSSQIDQSTKTIVGTFKAGFTALADYYIADAKVDQSQLLKNLQLSTTSSDKLIQELTDKIEPLTSAINNAVTAVQVGNALEGVRLALNLLNAGMKVIEASSKLINPFAHLAGTAYVTAVTDGIKEVADVGAAILKLGTSAGLLAKESAEFREKTEVFGSIAKSFKDSQLNIAALQLVVETLGSGANLSPAEAISLTDAMMNLYNSYTNPVTQSQIDDLADSTRSLMNMLEEQVSAALGGANVPGVVLVSKARNEVNPVFSRFTEVFVEQKKQFVTLGDAARAAVHSRSASNIGTVAANMGTRRLQAAESTFKPFYSMAYAGLNKLFMQYKIQQAALQFCNFHEYKLGGNAPSMCGSTKFYTAADILKMRSYEAPQPTAIALNALLSTRPTAASDDTTNGVAKPRPYLDLEKLLNGETVSFALPIKDLAWLRQYGWIFRTDTDKTIGGMFVQSLQIVLPFTSTSNDSSSSLETFDMVVAVKIGSQHRLSASNLNTYVLPPTNLRFSSAINAPLCPKEITNPYHQSAKCVKGDGTSALCVYDDGKVARKDILPSLFSTWDISMPRDGLGNVGKGYKLALPSKNGTSAVDFNVIAMLNVVRVLAPETASIKAKGDLQEAISVTAEPVCCASDEYFAKTACAKCPAGSTGALNGYTCQRQ